MTSATRIVTRGVSLVVVLAALGLLLASAASAETCNASSTAEFAACVTKTNAASGASTIVLAAGIYQPEKTVTFTNTSGTVTVEGPAGSPTVGGQPAELAGEAVEPFPSELVVVNSAASVMFKHVEIVHGGGTGVPAVKVNAEPEGTSPKIGKIALEQSLLGGNIGTGITLNPGAEATVRNSTLSDNSAFAFVDGGKASFFNSTVAFNKGGGVQNIGSSLSLTNTIVAENKVADCKGKATASDHSLDSDGTCNVGALSKTNPMLEAKLENDGGTTQVHPLETGSPAISAGDEATCTSEDQRGAARPGIAGKPCSIGAYEYSVSPPEAVTGEATEVTETTAALNATVNPKGHPITNCTFEYGPSIPYTKTAPCASTPETGVNPEPVTAAIGSLSANTTYHFKIVAENASTATKSEGSDATFKTSGAVVSPPTAVTGKASSITEAGATLNATVNPNGTAVTKCTFEYAAAAFFEIAHTYELTALCSPLPGSGASPKRSPRRSMR